MIWLIYWMMWSKLRLKIVYVLFIDISLLYNPLIYPNSLFWPPTFLLPYHNAAAAAAVAGLTAPQLSPSISNRYTLTPDKEDTSGESRTPYLFYSLFCPSFPQFVTLNLIWQWTHAVFHMIENEINAYRRKNHNHLLFSPFTPSNIHLEIDEDEPLNLSLRSSRSNPSVNIWSPASLCEKESASDCISIKEELDCKTDILLNNCNLMNVSSATTASLLQKIQRRVNETAK